MKTESIQGYMVPIGARLTSAGNGCGWNFARVAHNDMSMRPHEPQRGNPDPGTTFAGLTDRRSTRERNFGIGPIGQRSTSEIQKQVPNIYATRQALSWNPALPNGCAIRGQNSPRADRRPHNLRMRWANGLTTRELWDAKHGHTSVRIRHACATFHHSPLGPCLRHSRRIFGRG